MNETRLQNATLLTWTLQVYKDFKLGIAQTPPEAIARSMQNHKEWWPDWEAFDRGGGVEDATTTARLVHIHHDAKVLAQVEQAHPEIRGFYDALREKGFSEFESVHTIALGLTEEFAHSREHNEDFDSARYIERAAAHTKESLARPTMARVAGRRAY